MDNIFNQTTYLFSSQNELEESTNSYQTCLLSTCVQGKAEGVTLLVGESCFVLSLVFSCLISSFPRLGFHMCVQLGSRELRAVME